MLKDFTKFLKEFNVAALAIGFVMGTASTTLINSMVKDVFMPIVAPLLGTESWRDALWHMGPVHIAIGSFAAELFNFLILAFIIFVIAKKILKMETVPKK